MSNRIRTLRLANDLGEFGSEGAVCFGVDEGSMLKITVVNDGVEHRLVVEGKLAEPCVSVLESAWNQIRQTGGSHPIMVDLSGVTLINPRGEATLRGMVAEGACLTAKGLYCEFVVKQLMNEARKVRTHQSKQNRDVAKDSSLTDELSRVVQCLPNKET